MRGRRGERIRGSGGCGGRGCAGRGLRGRGAVAKSRDGKGRLRVQAGRCVSASTGGSPTASMRTRAGGSRRWRYYRSPGGLTNLPLSLPPPEPSPIPPLGQMRLPLGEDHPHPLPRKVSTARPTAGCAPSAVDQNGAATTGTPRCTASAGTPDATVPVIPAAHLRTWETRPGPAPRGRRRRPLGRRPRAPGQARLGAGACGVNAYERPDTDERLGARPAASGARSAGSSQAVRPMPAARRRYVFRRACRTRGLRPSSPN